MKHGLALCCNVSPHWAPQGNLGRYECPICKREVGGWSLQQEWIAGLWNKQAHKCGLPAPELDVGWAWRFAELRYIFHPPYGERVEIERNFILFQISERPENKWLVNDKGWNCVIDDTRCFRHVRCRRFDGTEFELREPELKTAHPVSIYVNRAGCTDKTWWYVLNVTTYNYKWNKIMREGLGL